MNKIYTAEFVTPKHPDKLCDRIADSILDSYRKKDPLTRGAIEVMGGHGIVTVKGEVASSGSADIQSIVREIVPDIKKINARLVRQSPEIARGVDAGGAGDQGIMIGYACAETLSLMPYEYELARGLAEHIYESFPYDGKTQVTAEKKESGWKVKTVVASFQNVPSEILQHKAKEFIPNAEEYFINPAGNWNIGGFDADTGLTGRKIVVDAYGPRVPVGGGAFSGKDYTKVDRTGAYMARKIACSLLAARRAREVQIKIAYAIGRRDPVKASAVIDGVEERISGYDLSPKGMAEALFLDTISFSKTAEWGHFGRGFPWDA